MGESKGASEGAQGSLTDDAVSNSCADLTPAAGTPKLRSRAIQSRKARGGAPGLGHCSLGGVPTEAAGAG